MEQNSDEWTTWRRNGLGSSDAPIVLGLSPWTTRYQLWERKCGLAPEQGETFITERGHRLEPRARAAYEIANGFVEMPPALVEHAAYPFLRASLDGYNPELNRVLEIKAPGAESHAIAKAGKVPEHYWPQVQQQLLITGAERVDYFSYFVTDEGKVSERVETATVIVYPDVAYCRYLLGELCAFWQLIVDRTPPAKVDKDYKSVRNKELSAKVKRYMEFRKTLANMERELLSDPLVAGKPRWRNNELRVWTNDTKGDTLFEIVAESEPQNEP